ncbi:NAD(P)/FAD-dependent oxidoreductase [Pseudoalteromonas luteoviolacea]|uniref:NAD(P)/FAD-dependent oxidoreductase n=1 Tax=Pseudoalteromonas luteoviolacea TaxID=43657 RepID=UPI00114D808E|nr:FAD-dependent oxidoreductase [Pseudoalteromonas luteoviolacea]TQF69601.1 FAD-dependent oxidoreductase [Pseudoalteromonas luteoviolacea]
MNREVSDVIIIGAGPAGAATGAMLARQGYQVTIIEKQHFPRFSIGESLLPQCMSFLKEAGLEPLIHDAAQHLGFQYKDGATFQKLDSYTSFDFEKKFSEGPFATYQVKRADFDHLLAKGAAQFGADIRFGHAVEKVDVESDMPVLDVLNEQGEAYQLQGRFLLDASGFARVLPRLLDLERPSCFPSRKSFFTHITDKIQCDQFDRNKILITVHPESPDIWLWLIPFSDGTSSIGVVGKEAQFCARLTEQETLKKYVYSAPNLAHLLQQAEWPNDVNSIKGYSADVTHLSGKNYALLGNAGEFLDPVFSSGVTIALKSASLISPLVVKYLEGEKVDFKTQFEVPLRKGVDCFKTFVSAWYTAEFQDIIFYDEQDANVKSMICSILAGYAWDEKNPYVAQSERRLKVLVDLCRM